MCGNVDQIFFCFDSSSIITFKRFYLQIIMTVGSLSVCVHRQRVRQKPTYAIVHDLQGTKGEEAVKMELTMA